MKLTVFKDDQLVNEIELASGQLYTVGRQEDCHIVLDKLPGISREHFEIDEDGSGHWRVNVLSEVMLLQFNGQEQKDFLLQGKGEFFLGPYRFTFVGEAAKAPVAEAPAEASENFSDIEVYKGDLENIDSATATDSSPSDEFSENDEKTAIHGFSGIPYIKIMGEKGKKSEYFRLEGNLWVVGGDESASVYIREASASPNHFEISKTEKGFFIIDSGTKTGTELNGQKLTAKKPSRLLSGDIINVGTTAMQFELRDKAFQRKVSNIPLNMYKNPLVFFDKDIAMVNFADEEVESGKAEELKYDPVKESVINKQNIIRIVAVLVVLAVVASSLLESPADNNNEKIVGADPFSKLSPAEQKIVKQTYKLSKQLYLSGNFELALVQLEKLHTIIPSFKDSQEMEEYCINSRDLRRQQADIENQRRQQEEMAAQVRSIIAQCTQRYARSTDVDGAKACLAPAMNLDPDNPELAQLVSDVAARLDESKVREQMAREMEDKIRRGKELYQNARKHHKGQNYFKAIEAYENHIHSGLPDPKRLVKKSKRFLASIEWKIKKDKEELMSKAQSAYSAKDFKGSIQFARQAERVDPYDPKISSFLFRTEKELTNRMKNIYMDSVIEERYGNFEASRIKWEEILEQDVDDGEYYRKAKRKLKHYGYKH